MFKELFTESITSLEILDDATLPKTLIKVKDIESILQSDYGNKVIVTGENRGGSSNVIKIIIPSAHELAYDRAIRLIQKAGIKIVGPFMYKTN